MKEQEVLELKEMVGTSPELEKLRKLTVNLVERDIEDYYELTQRYKNIFEESPIAILYIHLEQNQIVGCNKQAERLLHKKEKNLIGKKLKDITEDLIDNKIKISKSPIEVMGKIFRWWFKSIKPNGQRYLVAWFTPKCLEESF